VNSIVNGMQYSFVCTHSKFKESIVMWKKQLRKQRSQNKLHHLKDWTGDIQNNCTQHNPQKHYKPKT